MLRVLNFQITSGYGGIERFLCNVTKEINDQVFMDFVTYSDKPAYSDVLKECGSNIYYLPSEKNIIKHLKAVNELLKKNKYDLIHFHKNSLVNIITYIYIKKHYKIPIIVHSHNTDSSIKSKLKFVHFLNRKYVSKTANGLFACSNLAKEWLFAPKEYYRVKIIHNSIDCQKYAFDNKKRELLRHKYKADDVLLFGMVGRLNEQKNPFYALELFSKISEVLNDVKFIIVGEGELLSQLKKKTEELKIDDKVIFTGNVSNVEKYLSAIDVLLMPSLYEGFPIAAIEAQASGVLSFFSTNITDEIDITDRVNWINIENSIEETAGNIIDIIGKDKNIDRADYYKKVEEKGFDLKYLSNQLVNEYKNIC